MAYNISSSPGPVSPGSIADLVAYIHIKVENPAGIILPELRRQDYNNSDGPSSKYDFGRFFIAVPFLIIGGTIRKLQ